MNEHVALWLIIYKTRKLMPFAKITGWKEKADYLLQENEEICEPKGGADVIEDMAQAVAKNETKW